jgi:hypothetical protein
MPQVHAVLLEQLDLVPSKGGIEAAGLRFMQLQVSRGRGGPRTKQFVLMLAARC